MRTAIVRGIWHSPILPLCVLVAATALIGASGPGDLQSIVKLALINVTIVVGLYTFVGVSGVLSFGHLAFMAIGAYLGALLTMDPVRKETMVPKMWGPITDATMGPIPAIMIAALAAAVFAVVVGLVLMRLSDLAAGIATLSLLVICQVVLRNWQGVTGNSGLIPGVPQETTIGLAMLFACAAIVLVYVYQESRFGLRLRASRQDDVAAEALGVNIVRERLRAWALSAFLVALGGALYGLHIRSLTPDSFYFTGTIMIFAMLVVGGIRSLSGAVIGCISVSALIEVLRRIESGISIGDLTIPSRPGLQEVGLSLLLILVLMRRPAGITGGREISLAGMLSRRRKVDGAQDDGTGEQESRSEAASALAPSGPARDP